MMFELLEKELECDFAYIESEIANAEYESFDPDYFLEAGDNSAESFFDRIVAKLQEIVERVKKAFSTIFAKKSVDKVTEKYDAAKEKDPSVANKKVKMKDYKKLQELNDNTMTVLLKTEDGEKIKKQMIKYRKQRNKILALGTVAVVSLGTCIHFMSKGYKKKMAKIEKDNATLTKQVAEYKRGCATLYGKLKDSHAENKSLRDENEILKQNSPAKRTVKRIQIKKADASNAINSAKGVFTGIKESISAQTEVFNNQASDTVSMAKDVVTAVASAKSPVGAAKAVGKTTSSVKNLGSNIKAGVTKEIGDKAVEYKEKIQMVTEKMEKAKKVMENNPPDSEKHKKAAAWLKKADPNLKKLKTTYATLMKQANK